jgi:stage II sporulation protein D
VFTEVPSPRLDVALALDRASATLVAGSWVLRAGERLLALSGAVTFTSSAAFGSPLFVVQAGSYTDGGRARAEADRIAAALAVVAVVADVTEAAPGASRFSVRVGTPSERPAAETLLARVRRETAPDAFLVGASPAPASAASVFVETNGLREELPSPVEVADAAASFIPFGEGTWRGHLLLRATGRGTLHVLDRVSLEDYLRGVVPAEMGPKVFDEIEALKAQAVAARSYALRRKGDFAAEGYDLCATPRCQVYGGAGIEQAMTDRAVSETAGEVLLWDGRVANTLFTSTCGGRTEDAADVFPSYASGDTPYLSSVACWGEERLTLTASASPAPGALTLLGVRGRALLASLGNADLGGARAALRERLGLAAGDAPRRLAPVNAYADVVASAGISDPAILVSPPEIAAAPASWPERSRAAWALCTRFQLSADLPVDRNLRVEEVAGLYAAFLSRLGGFEEVEARLVGLEEDGVVLKGAKGKSVVPLGERLALFRGGRASFSGERRLVLTPGDHIRAFLRDGKLVGLAAADAPAAGTWERDSTWVHWTRSATGPELAARLNERDPGRRLGTVRALEVLDRTPSGRARRVRVVTDGEPLVLSGLEIRFSLGVPEDLFALVRGHRDGVPVFTFFGRGWGHGVGLCQNGAFGMALAGKSYREILAHYYPGAVLGPIPPG